MTEEFDKVKEIKKTKKLSGVKYIGGNMFLHGVPRRDMPADEWLAFTEEERDHFVKLGLYEVIYD